jgi:tetratricopeptide (TPR) repeat protein
MKLKYFLVAFLAVSTFTANAQKVNTTSAAVAYKSAQKEMMYQKFAKSTDLLAEAKELIDKSSVHEDTKTDAKTWYYKALIYMDYSQAIAMSGDSVKMKAVITEEYGNQTKKAFENAVEFDKKGRYKSDLQNYVKSKADMLFNIAGQQYGLNTDEGFGNAQQAYFGAAEMMSLVEIIDTNAYVNAAICAEKIKKYDLAVNSYKVLAEHGYRDGLAYYYMAYAYNQLGDDTNYKKAIDDGLAKHPGKKELIIESVNYNLSKGNKEEALKSLEKAIELDPTNKTVYFAAGSTFQDLMDADDSKLDEATKKEFLEKAGSYYDKALEIDPNYQDAAYNKGAMYLNAGIDMDTKANNLPLGDPNEAKYKAEAKTLFEKAISALEIAHKLDAKNKPIVKYLKILYGKVGNKEKQLEMNNLLKTM